MGPDSDVRPVVLVVEDDAMLRMETVDTLEDAGFEPLAAANADYAIEILEDRADVRIVFTDIQMPGSMDGIRLARAVHDRWPPIQIILTSGRTSAIHDQALPSGALFFAKPIKTTEVIGAMRKFVAGG